MAAGAAWAGLLAGCCLAAARCCEGAAPAFCCCLWERVPPPGLLAAGSGLHGQSWLDASQFRCARCAGSGCLASTRGRVPGLLAGGGPRRCGADPVLLVLATAVAGPTCPNKRAAWPCMQHAGPTALHRTVQSVFQFVSIVCGASWRLAGMLLRKAGALCVRGMLCGKGGGHCMQSHGACSAVVVGAGRCPGRVSRTFIGGGGRVWLLVWAHLMAVACCLGLRVGKGACSQRGEGACW